MTVPVTLVPESLDILVPHDKSNWPEQTSAKNNTATRFDQGRISRKKPS